MYFTKCLVYIKVIYGLGKQKAAYHPQDVHCFSFIQTPAHRTVRDGGNWVLSILSGSTKGNVE